MKCPITGKICLLPKEIQITEINDGEVSEIHLCQKCGSDYLKDAGAEVTTKLTELVPTGITEEIKNGAACPICGSTIQDVLRNQRVGCATCWEFHKELIPITMLSQNNPEQLEHVGKVPANNKEMQRKHFERLMQDAITKEDYETAAKMRDKIKELDKI